MSPYSTFGHAGAAIALEGGAEETELAHGLDQFAREAAVAVALFDDGNEVVFDELARGVAHQALVVAEQRVEVDEVHTAEFRGWHWQSPHKGCEWQTIQTSREEASGATWCASMCRMRLRTSVLLAPLLACALAACAQSAEPSNLYRMQEGFVDSHGALIYYQIVGHGSLWSSSMAARALRMTTFSRICCR